MRRLTGLLLVLMIALPACWPISQHATVEVHDGAKISLVVRPMFSFHSDWYRKLVIETQEGSFEQALFEDTGWWRGSNLYLHKSGIYILHEGQAGCMELTVLSPQLDSYPEISCEKSIAELDGSAFGGNDALQRFPPSKFYKDFMFIGHFMEKPNERETNT